MIITIEGCAQSACAEFEMDFFAQPACVQQRFR
jgi:hypothetical protein